MPFHHTRDYDRDDTGRTCLTDQATDWLEATRKELEGRPAFVYQAVENLDADALAAAYVARDGAALLALLDAAVKAKRHLAVIETLRHEPQWKDESDALATLLKVYA